MKLLKAFAILLIILTAAACGGGGGTVNPITPSQGGDNDQSTLAITTFSATPSTGGSPLGVNFGEVTFKGAGIPKPISFYGDWVRNQDAPADDTGWQIGASIGELKVAHDWQLAWDYKKVEKDAVLGALSDSDFCGGGTDGKGHRFGFAYQITDAASAALTYFIDDKGLGGPKDYRRLQLDFNFKF
jgi:hypothetical protein